MDPVPVPRPSVPPYHIPMRTLVKVRTFSSSVPTAKTILRKTSLNLAWGPTRKCLKCPATSLGSLRKTPQPQAPRTRTLIRCSEATRRTLWILERNKQLRRSKWSGNECPDWIGLLTNLRLMTWSTGSRLETRSALALSTRPLFTAGQLRKCTRKTWKEKRKRNHLRFGIYPFSFCHSDSQVYRRGIFFFILLTNEGPTGGLINPRPRRRQYRAGFSNTGGSPKPRKRAPCQKKTIWV